MSKRTLGWGCALVAVVGLWGINPLPAQDVAPVVTPTRQTENAEQRINAALGMPLKTPLQYDGEQLNLIFEAISEEYGIPIVFDRAALDEVAISPEAEVSINLQNVSLNTALSVMLKEPGLEDLKLIVDHEILLVTTKEQANAVLKVQVYRVDDLIAKTSRFNALNSPDDYDELIDVIVACVEHDSWMENGKGEGEVQAFSPGLLVVTQTQNVQEQVADLLAKLRQAKSQIIAPVESPTETSNKPITRGFDIQLESGAKPSDVQKQLAAAIKKSVDWSVAGTPLTEEDVWLEVLPDRVLVRHSPDVLNQIATVLWDMRLLAKGQMSESNSTWSHAFE